MILSFSFGMMLDFGATCPGLPNYKGIGGAEFQNFSEIVDGSFESGVLPSEQVFLKAHWKRGAHCDRSLQTKNRAKKR
jgi:hypothetical protein